MGLNIEGFALLLLVAAIAAMLARRARLPYTVVLVGAGIGLSAVPALPAIALTRQLLFTALLPPLLFEAALYIPWRELRRELGLVCVLATLGVVLSAAITTAGMRWVVGWPLGTALLFGVLIAATDPVSVIATFRQVGAPARLKLLVESESLLNDGTAAVAFGVAVALVQGGPVSAVGVAGALVVSIAGGVACGLLVGGAMLVLAGQTEDHLVELTFTTVAAYGSFLLAEHFHVSGVLATIAAGLLLGSFGSLGSLTDRGREAVASFWEYAAFVANSLVFLLIGARLAHQHFGALLPAVAAAVGAVLLGRAAAVYVCCALFARSARRVPIADQHVLFWGGLRGALALALALGLPVGLPGSAEIRTAAFAVVAFSVVVQGLTVGLLLPGRRPGRRPRRSAPPMGDS